MGVAGAVSGMDGTTQDGRIRIDGRESYESVDCQAFVVDGLADVSESLLADEVTVDGQLSVGARLDAGVLEVDGQTRITGDLVADDVTVDGQLEVGDRADVGAVEVDGQAEVSGDLSSDRVRVDGVTTVSGNLDAHDVIVEGSLETSGNLVAASVRIEGSASVGGLTDVTDLEVAGSTSFDTVNVDSFLGDGAVAAGDVSATRFELVVEGRSVVDTLESDEVVVRTGEEDRDGIVRKLLGSGERVFEAGTVEADTVELESTRADVVVGERVTLGRDTEVGTVYADECEAHPGAVVGTRKPLDAF